MDLKANYTAIVNNLKNLNIDDQQQAIADSVSNLPESKKAETIANAAKDLTLEQQKFVASSLFPPSPKANDSIWLIVIGSFAVVLVGIVAVMSIGWFLERPFEPSFLTIFTTVTAFLIGLFAQSPVK